MKKIWEKHSTLIFVIVGVIAFASFIFLSYVSENTSSSKTTEAQKDTTVLTTKVPNDEYSVVVIGLTYCGHCHNFNPVITKISEEYNLPLYWFDIDDLDSEDSTKLSTMFESHGYEGSSPYIAVLKKGEVVTTHVGEMARKATLSFLKEAGAIK